MMALNWVVKWTHQKEDPSQRHLDRLEEGENNYMKSKALHLVQYNQRAQYKLEIV